MIEIEDEYSENWAELTQCYYAENRESYPETAVAFPDERVPQVTDRDEVHHHERPEFSRSSRRFQGASTSEFENEYPSLTEGAWSKQRERDFDVRNRLNRSRFQGASTSEFENEYPSLTEGAWSKQRERDFDVRNRLNRSRFQGASTSEFENEYPSLTEGAWSKQRERDFDVRNRLNRSRFQGASQSEFENEYPSLTVGAWSKQRERDFDVRNRPNRSRRGDYHGDNGPWRRDRRRGGNSDNVPWKSDHSRESYDDSSPNSYRPRSTHRSYETRSNETSPFRSPLNRAKQSGFGDLDNSSNFRFTSNRRGDDRSERVNDNTRSCRRLYSPSQDDDDDCEDETNKRFQVVTEEDKVKMARREKDIAYGRSTDDYKTYLQAVPKHRREKDRKVHPRTPDKYVNCSRKYWDGQVKVWKLSFHAWAASYQDASSRGDCSQKSSCSEGTTLTSECKSEKEEDKNLVLADDSFELSEGEDEKEKVDKMKEESFEVSEENVQYIDEEAEEIKKEIDAEEESKEKEEDDFLDAVDYSSLVGNQGD